jgi:hypothetical protein
VATPAEVTSPRDKANINAAWIKLIPLNFIMREKFLIIFSPGHKQTFRFYRLITGGGNFQVV